MPSEHPSIFLEDDFCMEPKFLEKFLDKIKRACKDFDEGKIINILNEMPLEYSMDSALKNRASIGYNEMLDK